MNRRIKAKNKNINKHKIYLFVILFSISGFYIIMNDFGLIKLSTRFDKNIDEEISIPFEAIIISASKL